MISEVGQKLKTRREELGLTLQEASLSLKINTRVLEAIEENKTESLPPRTFLRGFIQSYANFLRLDTADLLDGFQTTPNKPPTRNLQTPSTENPSDPAAVSTVASSSERLVPKNSNSLELMQPKSKTSSVLIGILAVVMVVAIFGLLRTIEKYQSESQRQPVEGVESLQDTTSGAPAADGAPATTDVTAANASPTVSEKAGATPAPTTAPTPEKTVKENINTAAATATTAAPTAPTTETPKAATPTPAPTQPVTAPAVVVAQTAPPAATAPQKTAEPAATAAAASAPAPTEAKADSPQEVIIEALDKVSVDYQIDDEPRQVLQLNADELRTLKAKRSLSLRVSDGGAVSLVHNGRDRGVPGNIGQPISLNFPRKTQ